MILVAFLVKSQRDNLARNEYIEHAGSAEGMGLPNC